MACSRTALTSVNPPMKSTADEEEQSPLSKIVRLPFETEYTCSVPSKCAVMLPRFSRRQPWSSRIAITRISCWQGSMDDPDWTRQISELRHTNYSSHLRVIGCPF